MRAILCEKFGGLENIALGEAPAPTVGTGQLLVDVKACGVNFADIVAIQGNYQVKVEPPFIPGNEIAGEVIEVGPGVTGFAPGDRVAASIGVGGYAERAVAFAATSVKIPDQMDYVTAAGFVVTYGTSHFGLVNKAELKAGEWLLVNGAAGGVGLTAVEIGKVIGAKVIALAGGADKLEICKSRGADYLIDYRTEDVRARVKEITGGPGADVVYDPVGGKAFTDAFRATAREARVMIIGFASGDVPPIPANIVLVKNLKVIGYFWGAYHELDPKGIHDSKAELMQWFVDGKIEPHISATYPLEQTRDAITLLETRQSTGKVVVTID